MTALSRRECVRAPMYWESHRMITGKKKPKRAETAGGRTPETIAKVVPDVVRHSSRKPTYVVSYKSVRCRPRVLSLTDSSRMSSWQELK